MSVEIDQIDYLGFGSMILNGKPLYFLLVLVNPLQYSPSLITPFWSKKFIESSPTLLPPAPFQARNRITLPQPKASAQ